MTSKFVDFFKGPAVALFNKFFKNFIQFFLVDYNLKFKGSLATPLTRKRDITLSLTLFSSWRAIWISSSVHRSSIGIVFLIGSIWTRFSGRGGADFEVRIEDGLFADIFVDVSSRFEFRVIRLSGSGSDSSRSEFRVTLRSIVSDGITSRIEHKSWSNRIKSYQVEDRILLENDFLYLNHLMHHFLYRLNLVHP